MGDTAFREATKDEFKEIYFRLGGGQNSGWTADYWQQSFEETGKPNWRFMVQEPLSPEHGQMWIATDNEANQYRLFFMTEASTENFFDHPGKE